MAKHTLHLWIRRVEELHSFDPSFSRRAKANGLPLQSVALERKHMLGVENCACQRLAIYPPTEAVSFVLAREAFIILPILASAGNQALNCYSDHMTTRSRPQPLCILALRRQPCTQLVNARASVRDLACSIFLCLLHFKCRIHSPSCMRVVLHTRQCLARKS